MAGRAWIGAIGVVAAVAAAALALRRLADPGPARPGEEAAGIAGGERGAGETPPALATRPLGSDPAQPRAGSTDGGGGDATRAARGSRIGGRVEDAAGQPIAGAKVSVVGAGGSEADARTDGDGRFSIEAPPGDGATLRIEAPGLADRLVPVATLASGTAVRLAVGWSISGRLEDATTGAPVAGVGIVPVPTVSPAGPGERSTLTREDGSFDVPLPGRGTYVLEVGARALRTAGEADEWIPTRVDDVEAGSTGVRIRVSRGLSIEGRIEDETGERVPVSVVVTAIARTAAGDPDYTSPRMVVVPAGEDFRVPGLRPGRYDLRVQVPPSRDAASTSTWSSAVLRSVETGARGVRITLPRGRTLLGRLVDGAGAPVLDLGRVRAWREGESGTGLAVDGVVSGDGTFRVGPLDEADRYDLRAEGFPGRGPAVLEGVSPRDVGVVVVLPVGGRIVGRIQTEDGGAPPPGVPVGVVAEGVDPRATGTRTFAYSQPGGAFAVEGLPDLPFTVEAGGGRSGFLGVAVPGVRPGEKEIVLTVSVGVTLSGTLVDEKGEPVSTTSLEADDGARRAAMRPYAQVGPDGRFVLRGLRAGKVRLAARMGDASVPLGEVTAPAADVKAIVPSK